MSEITPRVNASLLERFQHKRVRFIGKVTQLRGEQATIDSNGPIILHLQRDSHLALDHAFEILGKVNPDLSVKVLTSTDFGTEFNYAANEAVVDACHRYKEIFYDDD